MATTTQRGYGWTHAQARQQWVPVITRGDGWCHAERCLYDTRWIPPDWPWDLGHTPDRSAYTGPEHAKCNRSEGATRGNAARGRITVRDW